MAIAKALTYLFVFTLAVGVVAVYTGLRLFMSLGQIRKESKEGAKVAGQVREEWTAHEQKQTAAQEETTRQLDGRMTTLEQTATTKIAQFEENLNALRDHVVKLEDYLHEFFEVEVKNVFDSFDNNVCSVLDQMKAELMRGVSRIEEIQTVVTSKGTVQDRVLEGKATVQALMEGSPAGPAPEAEPGHEAGFAEADPEAEPQTDADAVEAKEEAFVDGPSDA